MTPSPRRAHVHRLPLAFAFTLGALACAGRARALPLYAADGTPCARCHVAGPVLNAAGERVLARGEGDSARALRAPGAVLPLAVTFEAGAFVARGDSAGGGGRRTDGEFRLHALDIHAAAALDEHVSFRVRAGLDSSASTWTATTAVARFDRFGPGGVLGVRAGVFEAGLPFLSRDRRPTRRDYLAPVEVSAHGAELTLARHAWTAAIGMMNSSRSGAGAGGGGFNRLEDTYARATRMFGGQELGARLLFDRQDSNISWHAWLQRLQAQVGGRLGAGRYWLVPAYTLDRFDDRPAPGIHQRHQYATLEALALLGPERAWTLAARAEHEHVTPTELTPGLDRDLEVLRVARAVNERGRVAVEWSRVAVTGSGGRESRVDALVQFAY